MVVSLPNDLNFQGWYSRKKTAEILGFSVRQIDRYLKNRVLKFKTHKITKERLVKGEEIAKFFNNKI